MVCRKIFVPTKRDLVDGQYGQRLQLSEISSQQQQRQHYGAEMGDDVRCWKKFVNEQGLVILRKCKSLVLRVTGSNGVAWESLEPRSAAFRRSLSVRALSVVVRWSGWLVNRVGSS